MSLATSPRLAIARERASLKAVAWDSLARASQVGQQDVDLLNKVSGGSSDLIKPGQEADYAALYARLLATVSRNEVRSSVLALLAAFIGTDDRHDERIKLLIDQRPYESLAKLLDSSEDFIRLESASILSVLAGADSDADMAIVEQLLSHLGRQLTPSGDADTQLVAAQCLAALLRRHDARTAAWTREQPKSDSKGKANGDKQAEPKVVTPCVLGGRASDAHSLVAILRSLLPTSTAGTGSGSSTPNSAAAAQIALQLQYHAVFSLWLLSYDAKFCEGVNKSHPQLFSTLVELARSAVKEKIVRVVIATFRNLVEKAPDANLAALLNAKTPAYLTQLQQSRRWGDEDIRTDVDYLADELKEAKRKLTTYDEYIAELESGELSWTPPHENGDFWRENAGKLNNKDQEQLKALLSILQTSSEPLVLSVALNDVGQYVRYCDEGKKNIEKLGGKTRAMELLQHPDADVKYRALTTVQKARGLPER